MIFCVLLAVKEEATGKIGNSTELNLARKEEEEEKDK